MPVVSVGQLTITDVNDGLNLVLSNESHNIPTDAAGNSPVFTGAVSTAKVLAGGVDVSSQWTITVITSVGLSGSFSNNTYTVTGLTTDTGTVEFKANRPGYSELSAIFTVTKSKKGDQGNPGLDGLTIVISNESHTLPASSAGAVSSYANSGTTIRVYEGSTELNAVSGATSNGSFGIGAPTQLPASTITVGATSYSGKIATVAAHSAMVAGTDSVVITYPITIKRANGSVVSTTKSQTLTKSKQGGTGGTGPTGPRGSVHLFKLITGSVWSDAEANSLFDSGQPHNPVRVADRVTLYNSSAGFSQTRAWTGSAWEIQTEVLDGNLLVTKSVTAAAINTADLYAQNVDVTGSMRVGNDTNYVQLGGDTFIRAQAGQEVLFLVPKTGRGLLQGAGLVPGSVLPDALSSAAIQRIRDELGGLVPEFGGTQSISQYLESGTYPLSAINSGGSPVEISFFHLGARTLSLNPANPSVTLSVRRGSTIIHGQTFTGESIPVYIGPGGQMYANVLPVIDWKMMDNNPGAGSIVYSVVVTVNNYPGGNAGNFNFVIIQSASGGDVVAKWDKVTGKPDTATRWPAWSEVTSKPATFAPSAHTHAWADITSGVPATATRWPAWSEVTSKPATFAPSAHTHDFRDLFAHGDSPSYQGRLMLASLFESGNKLRPDEEFEFGNNGVAVYNNSGGTAVTITRLTGQTAVPNRTGNILRVSSTTGTTSPGRGGFFFSDMTRAGAVYVAKIRARIPVGFSIQFASNATGTDSLHRWITSQEGTGKWEDYVHIVYCGNSGSFSSTNFFWLNGSGEVTWDIASATVIDITDRTNRSFNRIGVSNGVVGNLEGNANTATTLQTARTIGMTGDVTWTSAAFNGSANVTGTATLANSGVTAGTYTKVTVDAKGRVTAGASLVAADIPNLDAAKVTSGRFGSGRLPSAGDSGAIQYNIGIGTSAGLNTIGTSGFYRINNTPDDAPPGVSYGQMIVSRWSDTILQIVGDYQNTNLFFRGASGASASGIAAGRAWRRVITDFNVGSFAPSLTGVGASGTWGISVTGNAATATTLQTARTINGTSFNGSANITTANWGTARTLTIGNTAKSVNGSGNVSWSLAEIGALGNTGAQIISKAAHAHNANAYHLELKSPDSGSSDEVSLRMHQGNRFYGQIRLRGDGFHFTQGNNGTYRNIYFGSAIGAGHVAASRIVAGYDSGVANSINTSDWFRTSGGGGIFFGTYGGGLHMTDSTFVRVYNNKKFHVANTETNAIESLGGVRAAYIGIANTYSTTGHGVSLYGGATIGQPTYGVMFSGVGTFGGHGSVTKDWATYFTMNADTARGWIFKAGAGSAGNVASISGGGNAHFNGTVTAQSQFLGVSVGSSWINGHRAGTEAAIRITNVGSVSSFHSWISQRTPNGGWSQGVLGDNMYFNWATNANINGNVNQSTQALRLESGGRVVVNNQIVDINGVKFMKWSDFSPTMGPPAGLENVITANWLAAGVVQANIIASGGINVVDGGNKVTIHPKSNTPILFEKDGETTFSVNIDGTGFFKGSLAKDTVSAEALQDEAKKAINPRYLGGGERQVFNNGQSAMLNTTTSTTAAGQLATFTTLSQNDRVVLSARLQDFQSWTEGSGAEPAWVSSTFIVRFERSVNNGAWTTVGSQMTLNVPVYTYGGFQAPGEPYEPREKGYFYDQSLSFTDTVPSTSSNVIYRLYIQRTSPTGTVGGGSGPATGLRVITFTGERSAFNLNEIRGSTVKQWIDKDTGFSIVTGTVTRIGQGSDLVNFPTPFAEVYSCTLGFNRQNETAGTYRYANRYRSLTTHSVIIDSLDGHTGSPNVTSYQVMGRVAV